MKFKAYTGITWSLLELTELLQDEDSRVCFEKVKKHFGLHPFHLTNLHAALNEILSSKLNAYDPEVKGFLLAYRNPKLLTPLGEIFYDTCFIHVDVEADFYIFRPEVGCSLKGTVNKKGLSHIGLLVHKAFNVSVPKPDGEENWPGDKVKIGQEVRVHITHLDYTSRLPFIRGVLHQDDYLEGCKLPDARDPEENKRLSFCEYDQSDEDVPNSQDSLNKSNPQPFFTSQSEGSDSDSEIKRKQANTSISNEIKVEPKKTKKLKKDKNVSKHVELDSEQFNNQDETVCNDSENVPNSKKSLKKSNRRSSISDLESGSESEREIKRKQVIKEKLGKKSSCASNEIKEERKKKKKSKKSENESNDDILDEEQFNNVLVKSDNYDETDVTHEESFVEPSSKKSKSKSSKKSLETEINDSVQKVKRTGGNSEVKIEDEAHSGRIKKEKPPIERQSDVSDLEMRNADVEPYSSTATRKSSKKTKFLQSPLEGLDIKDEELSVMGDDASVIPRKKKSKHKEATDAGSQTRGNNSDSGIPKEIPKKSSKTSKVLNAEDSLITVKEETSFSKVNKFETSVDDNTEQQKKKKSKKQKNIVGNEEILDTSVNTRIEGEIMNSTGFDPSSEVQTMNIKVEGHGSNDPYNENKSKSKKSSEPMVTIPNAAMVKIKEERATSVSGSENATEDEKSPRKSKAKKLSKNKKHLNDVDHDIIPNESIESTSPVKKARISESENVDTTVSKKRRKSRPSISQAENSGASQTDMQPPLKKKSKKSKHVEEKDVVDDNSLRDETVNSTGFDPSSEIPTIRIKQEEPHFDYESYQNAVADSGKKKKKKKKYDRDFSDNEKFEPTFEVTIKTEQPENSPSTDQQGKRESSISPKKTHALKHEDVTSEKEVDSDSSDRRKKKYITMDKSMLHNVRIKVEKPCNDTSRQEEKRFKTSPSKHRQSSESDVDYRNTTIKVEMDS